MAQPDGRTALPVDEISIEICSQILEAVGHMTQASDWLNKAREDRDKAIARLRLHGWTLYQVAEFTKLSVSAISNIDKAQGLKTARVTTKG